jgi:hypothetical protein
VKKIKFTNAFFRSDNNKIFDLYSKEEVLKAASKDNIKKLEKCECFEDYRVVGFIFKDNQYVQIYNEEGLVLEIY